MMREKEAESLTLKLPFLTTQTTMSTNDLYDTTNNYDLFTATTKLTASVPFKWEQAPGKPIILSQAQISKIPSTAALELPPRLQMMTKMPPNEEEGEGYFGKLTVGEMVTRRERGRKKGGVFGSWGGNKDVVGGSFVFPSDYGGEDNFSGFKRVRRNPSFSSLREIKSHFWGNMYEGLKQVMPWRSKKLKKQGLKV